MFKNPFNNPGKIIKDLAVILFWIELGVAAIAAIMYIVAYENYTLAISIVPATFGAYVLNLLLYGYGEIVENSKRTANNIAMAARNTDEIAADIKSLTTRTEE
ncbi:MAG: hypothetical protein IKV43_06650 [Clostridia bacterium]|nr:hypothetical protein [Clostridia bacterium]